MAGASVCSVLCPFPKIGLSRSRRPSNPRQPTKCSADGVLFALYAGGIAFSLRRVSWRDSEDSSEQLSDGNRQLRRRYRQEEEEVAADDLRWTMMGLVACIPLVSWTSFVLGAITADVFSERLRFGAFAALYALFPLTHSLDFSEDFSTVLALALCLVHVQVERIAATDSLPSPRSVLRQMGFGVSEKLLDIQSELEWEEMQQNFEEDKEDRAMFDEKLKKGKRPSPLPSDTSDNKEERRT